MGENSSDFREALAELIDASGPPPAEHPSADRWLAYHRGELAASEEAALQEHLVRCRDCFDLAQAAEAFAEPGGEEGASIASTGLWRLVRQRLETAGEIPARAPAKPAWRRHFPNTLAAALFLALVGSTAWNVRQQSALAGLRAPRPDAPIVDFSAGERRAPAEITRRAGTGPWMLVFHPGDELPVYRLAIRDAATGRALSAFELRPNADLALTLDLPEGLPPGRYRLELAGGSGGSAGKVLETNLLRVTEAGPEG